jgi:hypothetical protein
MLAHRAPKNTLEFQSDHSRLAGFHKSPVTSHPYFFGRDSGGTNPDTR